MYVVYIKCEACSTGKCKHIVKLPDMYEDEDEALMEAYEYTIFKSLDFDLIRVRV